MSKRQKTGLTASRKKRVRPSRQITALDALDALNTHCDRIETLAGLLHACADPESFNVKLASDAGYYIVAELRQARELLAQVLGMAR
jgi:hypothetical protein